MRRRAAIALSLGALAGCTLLVDLSGLTGGPAAAPDAASPGNDATVDARADTDAGADARDAQTDDVTAGDGNATDVRASDALSPLGEAGCTGTVHDFCDDFDHGALGAMWTQVQTTGGTLTLDPVAVSPSSALLAVAAGGAEALLLSKNFLGTTKGLRCDFDMRVDAFDDYTDVLHVEFLLPTDIYFLRVTLGNGGDLNEYGQFADGGDRVRNNYAFTQPPAGAWVNVLFDVAAAGDAGTATLTIDQVQILSVPISPPTTTTGLRIALGASNNVAVAWRAHYDNVACDLAR